MKYRAEIDGLRALAILPVILFHAGYKIFSGGFVGVDVFFVISGYLITTIILTELEAGTFSLIHFYERRARRILPALFLVLFVSLPLAWFWFLPSEMRQFSSSLIAVSTFSSNIYFWNQSGYFDTANELKPLLHTWSLAVEEQYYVLFPLLLILIWKLGTRLISVLLAVVFVMSLAAAQWLSTTHPSLAFYILPTRIWEILIGAFIAFYYAHYNIKKHNHNIEQLGSLVGLSLIGYSVFAFNAQTPFPSFYTLAPTFGAALLIIFATHKTVVGKLLGSRLFVAIGLISYSAYLWHYPLFAFARQHSLAEPSMYLMSALIVLDFVLAYLSWKFVERPFRNKHRFSRNKVFVYGALCSAVFIGIGLAGYKGKISTLWQIQNPNAIAQAAKIEPTSFRDCSSEIRGYGEVDCKVRGNGSRVIVMWGDSHADVLSKYIPEIKGTQLYVISHLGCPPIIGVRRYDGLGNSANCNSVNTLTQYANFIKSLKPDTVILVARWTPTLMGRIEEVYFKLITTFFLRQMTTTLQNRLKFVWLCWKSNFKKQLRNFSPIPKLFS